MLETRVRSSLSGITIAVSPGGTPIIGGTPGSVLFVDSSGNLGQDNANFYWDDTNNRLGLGIAPTTLLQLEAANFNLKMRGNVNSGTYGYLMQSSTGTYVNHNAYASGANQFIADAGAVGASSIQLDRGFVALRVVASAAAPPTNLTWVEGLRVISTGFVAVGSTSADYKLDVRGSGNDLTSAGLQIRSTAALGNTSAAAFLNFTSIDSGGFAAAYPSDYVTTVLQDRMVFGANSTATGVTIYAPGAAQDIRFFAGSGTERMRIDSAGEVGIGIDPATLLHIYGADKELRVESSAGTPQFSMYSGTGTSTWRNWAWKANNGAVGNLDLYRSTVAGGAATTHVASFSSGGNLILGATSATSPGGFTPILAISGTTPAITLIESDVASNDWDLGLNGGDFMIAEDGTVHLRIIEDTGFAGFGTTTSAPAGNVHVREDSAASTIINDSVVSGNAYGFRLSTFGTANEGLILENKTNSVYTEVLRVDSSENVGIGATAFGTNATKVLAIGNGTEPSTSPADIVQLFSVDLSAGNATLGIRTETAVVSESVTSDATLSVRINGTTYKLCLKA